LLPAIVPQEETMIREIDSLVGRYERGALSRRELLAGLAALCVTPAVAAPSQQGPAPIEVSGFDHLAFRVSNLERSARFYQEHLGGRVRSQSAGAVFLDLGQHWLALFAPGTASTGYQATAVGVDHVSFHSTRQRSLDDRMRVLREHKLNPVSPAGSSRVYFKDPDGIILQLS
jgi:catechol 2,3-dioxygenase-like lactoylglutathione lyase family enzyme